MGIRCEHVQSLELWNPLKFWVAVATWQMCLKSHLSVIHVAYFLFWTCMSEIYFRPYFSLNWQMRNTKFEKNMQF